MAEPRGDEYASHRVHAPAELAALPDPTGAGASPDFDETLKAVRSTTS
ncbi:hypothetical protein [Streptomyces fagopyri]|nr:hypothetical protein [Streptomyces fagopyri]